MNTPMIMTLLTVTDCTQLTARVRRITFTSPDLTRLNSVAPDQQIKLFFSRNSAPPELPRPEVDHDVGRWYSRFLAIPEVERPWLRTYSIQNFRPQLAEIAVDFATHGGDQIGPGTRWALQAQPGQRIGFYGSAPSHFRPWSGQPWRLLVGDETAFGAMSAIIRDLPASIQLRVIAQTEHPPPWPELANVQYLWAGPADDQLLQAVRKSPLPYGSGHAWLAGEASVVRSLRRHLQQDRGFTRENISFTGYWRKRLSTDDELTAEDIADHAEE